MGSWIWMLCSDRHDKKLVGYVHNSHGMNLQMNASEALVVSELKVASHQ